MTNIKEYLLRLQNQICNCLLQEDSQGQFIEDKWQHVEGGGGITRVFSEGAVIEKAGVNFSHVSASKLPLAASTRMPQLANCPFQALGISVVVHPVNPYVPTSHFNIRYIQVEQKGQTVGWFGGGFDLTPYYGFEEDCVHWHLHAKKACDPFGVELYPKFKKWADDYFFLPHRNEPRGIGGIFFDDFKKENIEQGFAFIRSVGEYYLKAYQPLLNKRKQLIYGASERAFQLYRRGRYVEFNLLYDRGTLFGLQSGGRTESILMSLPPLVAWEYNHRPEVQTAQLELQERFLKPRNWIA